MTKNIDLSRLKNTDVLEPFVKQLEKIQKETGFKVPNIYAMNIIDGDLCGIAGYKPYEKRFYISSKYFNSKEALLDTLNDWIKNKVMPEQAKTIEYIAEHEIAHIRIPDALLNNNEALDSWKNRKLKSENDVNIAENYADATAIYRIDKKKVDNSIKRAIEYLTKGGIII